MSHRALITLNVAFSDLLDFDNSTITITFDPDEDEADHDLSAPVPIVDDHINEATEQVFVVQLRLISSMNTSSVNVITTRQTSLCRIIDDDCK